MKANFEIDASDFEAAARRAISNKNDMLQIAGAGSYVIINKQKSLVPVDTAATKTSIRSHITSATNTHVEDEVGPETEYAPVIEYGRKDMPNYPIQPFIRPSAYGKPLKDTLAAIAREFGNIVVSKWR